MAKQKDSIKVVGRAKQPKKKESLAKPKDPTHSQLCMAIVDYMRAKHPDKLFIHIANEGKRSPMQGKKLKDEGMLPGVADYFLGYAKVEYNLNGNHLFTPGLWIEVKTKKDKLSKTQEEFKRRALEANYAFADIKSLNEFIDLIEEYTKDGSVKVATLDTLSVTSQPLEA